MAWGKKPEEKPTPAPQPTVQPAAAKENPMPEKTKPAKMLTIPATSLEGIAEELKRFSRKLDDLSALAIATNPPLFKSGHAAVMAVKRASQDVSFEMKKLRSLLSAGE
jgi:hypothetical protein